MKNFKYAIFDMDGTLLDSMPYWRNIGRDYLIGKGLVPRRDIHEAVRHMSMEEAAIYVRNEYGIELSTQQIIKEINESIKDKYYYEAPLKPGAKEYLSSLKRRGISMCVATASSSDLAAKAFERLDVLKYFDRIISCDDVNSGKTQPDIYYKALEFSGAGKDETIIYEDANYAVKTAKTAGFYCVGVYDETQKANRNQIMEMSDRYIYSFEELL